MSGFRLVVNISRPGLPPPSRPEAGKSPEHVWQGARNTRPGAREHWDSAVPQSPWSGSPCLRRAPKQRISCPERCGCFGEDPRTAALEKWSFLELLGGA
eukprot:9374674-Alexandrium_andersonii.AAC.1